MPAFFVHHKEYVTDKNYQDDDVFFNINNTESLCKECHNKEHFAIEEEYSFDENGDLTPPYKPKKTALRENGEWAFEKCTSYFA